MKVFIDNEVPAFPVYDKNFDWSTFSKGPLPIFFDLFLYRNVSNRQFSNEFLNHKIVDSKGQEFIINGRKALPKWRCFIPGVKKSELKFIKTGMVYSVEEMKQVIVKNIKDNIEDENIKVDWVEKIIQSKTYEELFSGE